MRFQDVFKAYQSKKATKLNLSWKHAAATAGRLQNVLWKRIFIKDILKMCSPKHFSKNIHLGNTLMY